MTLQPVVISSAFFFFPIFFLFSPIYYYSLPYPLSTPYCSSDTRAGYKFLVPYLTFTAQACASMWAIEEGQAALTARRQQRTGTCFLLSSSMRAVPLARDVLLSRFCECVCVCVCVCVCMFAYVCIQDQPAGTRRRSAK